MFHNILYIFQKTCLLLFCFDLFLFLRFIFLFIRNFQTLFLCLWIFIITFFLNLKKRIEIVFGIYGFLQWNTNYKTKVERVIRGRPALSKMQIWAKITQILKKLKKLKKILFFCYLGWGSKCIEHWFMGQNIPKLFFSFFSWARNVFKIHSKNTKKLPLFCW